MKTRTATERRPNIRLTVQDAPAARGRRGPRDASTTMLTEAMLVAALDHLVPPLPLDLPRIRTALPPAPALQRGSAHASAGVMSPRSPTTAQLVDALLWIDGTATARGPSGPLTRSPSRPSSRSAGDSPGTAAASVSSSSVTFDELANMSPMSPSVSLASVPLVSVPSLDLEACARIWVD